MINNLEQIKQLLSWSSEDEFYFAQVLQRKKENPHIGSNSHVVKTYYITTLEQLDRDFPEMVCLAGFHNARVYINLNKRSFERTCFHALKKVTDIIMNKDYKQARKAYNSVCGEYATGDKTWVVDIDSPRGIGTYIMTQYIDELQPAGDKILAIINTRNGYHLITKPFNLQTFHEKYPQVEIHRNNPTILYIP